MLAIPLLATMFQYGAFAAADVLRTREALVAYSIGLTGLILVKVLAPGFYARQDIRTPVKIALLTLALTQLMNVAFIGWLKHAGLALSIGLASCVNAALLWRGLRQRGVYRPQAGWSAFMLKLLTALFVLGIVLWFAAGRDTAWLAMSGGERMLRLSGVVLAGLAAYFATLGLLGFRPRDFRRRAA
jgi:putative peptidoglycan lipid II flippase